MKTTNNNLYILLVMLLFVCPTVAQTENKAAGDMIRQALENTLVIVKLPMPATKEGVDLLVSDKVTTQKEGYDSRLRKTGTAIKATSAARITKVEVKKRLIIIHLNGGGFDWTRFPRSTSGTPLSSTQRTKSESEARAEDMVKRDPNNEQLKSDLAYERYKSKKSDMERQSRSSGRSSTEEEMRLGQGSRFNVKFVDNAVFPISPDLLKQLLGDYIDFSERH